MQLLGNVLRISLILVLAYLWVIGFPHDSISRSIGAHFPWTTDHSWRWAALITEGALIEVLATVPVGVLIAYIFPRSGVLVVGLLSGIFAIRVHQDGRLLSGGVYLEPYLYYHILTHFLFLLMPVAFAARLRNRSRGNVPVAEIS